MGIIMATLVRETLDTTVADLLTTDGTIPWSDTQTLPSEGYVLAIKGRGLKLRHPDPDVVDRWVAQNREWILRQGNPWNLWFGSWHDSDTGELYLDVSTVVSHRASALLLAKATGELAVWDLAEGCEIRV